VRSLLTLADGGMLVGTNAGGLARFNPVTDTFQTYPIGVKGTSDRKIYTLSDDHNGGVWIATDSGVDHLDLSTNTVTHLQTGPAISPRTFSVLQDRAGNLWLGNDNGLFVRRTGSDRFVRPATPDDVVSTVLHNQIWAIHEDREGRLWAGSGQAGAVYRDTDGTWHGVPGFSGYLDGAQQPTVRDFLETAGGVMWIGTDGSGVLAYRPGASRVKSIDHDPAIPSSLPGNTVRALLMDRSGNLWVATNLGIARSNPDARVAATVQPSPLEDRALSATNVHAIYVDTRDRIWLGLDGGHIDMIDLKTASMHHLHLGGTQLHRDVQAFAESADGAHWVGSQGLARIDPDTFAIQDSVEPRLANTPVLSMQRSGDTLLIGTYDGVYRYNTTTRKLSHFRHDPKDSSSLADDTVRDIARIGNQWWYGTVHGISVSKHASSNRNFTTLVHRADDPTSLPK
jgi:ligand-binding sensor domain-containing protein